MELSGKHVVLAGGSGFVGTRLATFLLEHGSRVTILSRREAKRRNGLEYAVWDARTLGDWRGVLEGADAIVNLVGRSVNCIKTPDHLDEIIRSRVEATEVLGQAMRVLAVPPLVWVQLTTAHIVGDPPTVLCDEDSPDGMGMAPIVGRRWEEALERSALSSQRKVIVRPSLVLGKSLGAGQGVLGPLTLLTKLWLGGRAGSGKQGFSWIHETDLCRLVVRGIVDSDMSGAYIASAPNPVSQSEFMRTMRGVLHRPFGLPAEAWMVRFGAKYLFRSDAELILYGRYIHSKRLKEIGFEFEFPKLEQALREIYGLPKGKKNTT